MERKIAGEHVDLENMPTSALEAFSEACQEALEQLKTDLSAIEGEIAARGLRRHQLELTRTYGEQNV